MTKLGSIKLSRFQCLEFIVKLDEIIHKRNCSVVFENDEFEELRKLWKFKPKDEHKLLPEDEKYYVEQLRIYLFHYSQ